MVTELQVKQATEILRQRDFTKPGLSASAMPADWLDQVTKFLKRKPTPEEIAQRIAAEAGNTSIGSWNTEVWANEVKNAFNEGYEPSTTTAENESLKHQYRIMLPLDYEQVPTALTEMGFDIPMLIRSEMDSDIGKLRIGKDLFTKKSKESDLLFSVLTGHIPETIDGQPIPKDHVTYQSLQVAQQVFAEIIQDLTGDPNIKTILNPESKDFDKLRELFKNNPLFQNWAHELPGLFVAISRYLRGDIDKEGLRTRVYGNLLHNGPASKQSFWKFITSILKPEVATELLKGGLFHDGKEAAYRISKHPGAILHNLLDRYDQATHGTIKIAHEIKPALTLTKLHDELFVGNPKGTIDQLEELHQHINQLETKEKLISKLPKSPESAAAAEKINKSTSIVSARQKRFLSALAEKMISRLETYQKFVAENVKYSTEAAVTTADGRQEQAVQMVFNHRSATGVRYTDRYTAVYDITNPKSHIFKSGTHTQYVQGETLNGTYELQGEAEHEILKNWALRSSFNTINAEELNYAPNGYMHGRMETLIHKVLNFLG